MGGKNIDLKEDYLKEAHLGLDWLIWNIYSMDLQQSIVNIISMILVLNVMPLKSLLSG